VVSATRASVHRDRGQERLVSNPICQRSGRITVNGGEKGCSRQECSEKAGRSVQIGVKFPRTHRSATPATAKSELNSFDAMEPGKWIFGAGLRRCNPTLIGVPSTDGLAAAPVTRSQYLRLM
jgi:hypothetical protein